jgi:hypothetical protein
LRLLEYHIRRAPPEFWVIRISWTNRLGDTKEPFGKWISGIGDLRLGNVNQWRQLPRTVFTFDETQ